jgi:hypothetical protein
MNEVQIIIIAICAIAMSYRAYKIGIRKGIDTYLEYCKDLSEDHNGKVLIHFYGQDIYFLNPDTQKKLEESEDGYSY